MCLDLTGMDRGDQRALFALGCCTIGWRPQFQYVSQTWWGLPCVEGSVSRFGTVFEGSKKKQCTNVLLVYPRGKS